MTIQLSVTIWTIICFVALMLILNNLLFKPILKIMDERKERINNAAQKEVQLEKIKAEHAALTEQKLIEFKEHERLELKAEIAKAREASILDIETAKKERIESVDACLKLTEQQHNEILEILSVHTMDIAHSFADSILKE